MDTADLLLLIEREGDLLRIATRFKPAELKAFYDQLHDARLIQRDTRAASARIWRLTPKGRVIITPAEVS